MTALPLDPVALARDLIRRPSITPRDEGAMDVLQAALEPMGFRCTRLRFGEVENLWAVRGEGGPHLCFAGHTDVVPPGDPAAWSVDPFEARVDVDGVLVGRGAADMKGAIAAWVAAVAAAGEVPGTLSFLITGDEEGPALDGTRRVVDWLVERGVRIDHCVVGEPSSAERLGDTVKVGRRGSINAWLTVDGRQGHVAYPRRAANPVPVLLDLLGRLTGRVLDQGWPEFPPSNLEVTTVDVANPATNVIPQRATARLNIRFNPAHRGADLEAWIRAEAAAVEADWPGRRIAVEALISGEAFLTEPSDFTVVVGEAVREVTGLTPEPSTTGGTSDARFIRALCPVVELGLVGATIHQVDEQVPTAEIEDLARVYAALIRRYFERFAP